MSAVQMPTIVSKAQCNSVFAGGRSFAGTVSSPVTTVEVLPPREGEGYDDLERSLRDPAFRARRKRRRVARAFAFGDAVQVDLGHGGPRVDGEGVG